MKKVIILFLSIISISAFCKTPQSEAEFKKISEEVTQVTRELKTAWETKNETALYSFNIEKRTGPLGEKISSFLNRNPDYKDSFHEKISVLNDLLDKIHFSYNAVGVIKRFLSFYSMSLKPNPLYKNSSNEASA